MRLKLRQHQWRNILSSLMTQHVSRKAQLLYLTKQRISKKAIIDVGSYPAWQKIVWKLVCPTFCCNKPCQTEITFVSRPEIDRRQLGSGQGKYSYSLKMSLIFRFSLSSYCTYLSLFEIRTADLIILHLYNSLCREKWRCQENYENVWISDRINAK